MREPPEVDLYLELIKLVLLAMRPADNRHFLREQQDNKLRPFQRRSRRDPKVYKTHFRKGDPYFTDIRYHGSGE